MPQAFFFQRVLSNMTSFTEKSIDTLIDYYPKLKYSTIDIKGISGPIYKMPIPVAPHYRGDIVISAHRNINKSEPVHRHDYFLINYVYRGEYQAIIHGKQVTLRTGDVYLSQPFVSHALLEHKGENDAIICVRIRKELIYKTLLPVMPHESSLLDFFIEPLYSDPIDVHHYLILSGDPSLNASIHAVFQILILDYVDMYSCYETVMESSLTMLFSFLSRCTKRELEEPAKESKNFLIDNVLQYLSKNYASASLKSVAEQFGYHPNYLSSLLLKETNKTFSRLIRDFRMERACALLRNSDLSIEKIAAIVGYPQNSNFYKIFRKEYSMSPQQYRQAEQQKMAMARTPIE